MSNNRLIRPVIVACLLSATVALIGCSPPLPKTWLPPCDDESPRDAPDLRTEESVGLSRRVQEPLERHHDEFNQRISHQVLAQAG